MRTILAWPQKLALAAVAVLAPIHAVMITVGALVLADLITGILAARKRNESITSAAIGRTISKMLVYQCAVVSAFLVEKYMLHDVFPAAKLVAGLIGVVELTSVLENAEKTLGIPIFRTIIKRLSSKNDR